MATETYEDTIPDTLDLSDRAVLGINAFTGVLDVPKRLYEMLLIILYNTNPPHMYTSQPASRRTTRSSPSPSPCCAS